MTAISLHTASVSVLARFLRNLAYLLRKAQADAAARGYDEQALLQFRLSPDMHPFRRQIFYACDISQMAVARIAGLEVTLAEHIENTLPELVGRIERTLAWLEVVPASALDGREEQAIVWTGGDGNTRRMAAAAYVQYWALPNVMFHIITTYNILRHNGVVLGKLDFLNGPEADPLV
ncbi:MAG: DUF1993 domain-containing protein [Betaproteobacteria bacterium]